MPTLRRRATADDPPPAAPQNTAAAREPDPETIARRAYERYQQRGGLPGQEWDDWFHAEQELRSGTRSTDDDRA